MKIVTILGTRPEVIRLSVLIQKLDRVADHILVHTGQNYTRTLRDVFFEELGVRSPDYQWTSDGHSFGTQVSMMFREAELILMKERPDKVLVLGDTNSALCAIVAERMGIPVVHMEAGNRCFDLEVPEEKNRKLIDAISTFALPYTPGSRDNLLREGIPINRIMVSGNPIYEVLEAYKDRISASDILQRLRLKPSGYFLVTTHRAENVDNPARLRQIFRGLELVAAKYDMPIIVSAHPRTRERLGSFGVECASDHIQLSEPFGFFDFSKLQQHALCVITDSGTVQEESCIFHVPTVTIRKTTERPETVDCGSNILAKLEAEHIAECVDLMVDSDRNWRFPDGYAEPSVSSAVMRLLIGGK